MDKLAVFDLDGTLIDSLRDIVRCCNEALAEKGFATHSYEKYLTYIGDGFYHLVRRALPVEESEEQVQEVLARYRTLYGEGYSKTTTPYEGIPAVLQNLSQQGFLLAVLSNKSDPFAKEMVEQFFPGVFDYVAGQKEGLPQKPNPAPLLQVCTALHISPEKAVMIGDSDVDIRTGQNAKVLPIGVSWGYQSKEQLLQMGIAVADSPQELEAQLLRL